VCRSRTVTVRQVPQQNGRVERFIGTVKRALATEPTSSSKEFAEALQQVRTWYNHERPHDHLQGRTPAEVWAGIDVFRAQPG
jgi:putative transposase